MEALRYHRVFCATPEKMKTNVQPSSLNFVNRGLFILGFPRLWVHLFRAAKLLLPINKSTKHIIKK